MKDIAIIGAGPAGIACAHECAKRGASVLLLEKAGENCQTFRTYYKDGKRVDKIYKGKDVPNESSVAFDDGTKESTLEIFDAICASGEFEYLTGAEVESVKRVDGGFVLSTGKGEFAAKNVVIAIGRMGKPNKPSYKLPSKLNKLINFNANDAQAGEKILVIGGGNSAAEYAVDLAEKASMTLCYRRAEFSRLNEINLQNIHAAAQAGKVALKMGTDITEVEEADGKPLVKFTDGSEEIYDRLIYGIGGSTPVDFLAKCGVQIDAAGVPSFDAAQMTNAAGIYVAGDIASKNGESIIIALNHATKIACTLFEG